MVDIDSIIRLNPIQQIHFEKEQNLFSIIKTVEYLVSARNAPDRSYFWSFSRNLHTPLANCLVQSTIARSELFCTSTSCARSRFRVSAAWTNLWSNITSKTVSQLKKSSRLANQITVVRRLTATSLKECSKLPKSSSIQWMSYQSGPYLSMSCYPQFATYNRLFRFIQTCQMTTKGCRM